MIFHRRKPRNLRSLVFCAAYYSDGAFHGSGTMEKLTSDGGRMQGSHPVKVGTDLVILLIPSAQKAIMIRKAAVRWVYDSSFGVDLNEEDCEIVHELNDGDFDQQGPNGCTTH